MISGTSIIRMKVSQLGKFTALKGKSEFMAYRSKVQETAMEAGFHEAATIVFRFRAPD
jgi:hypothetical protein